MKYLSSLFALTTCLSLGCGTDEREFTPWVLEELRGDDGFTLRMPEYEVPPGLDSQNCYFVQVPDIADGQDVWIDRIETAINPGSHHMNVFRVKTLKDLRPENGAPVMLGDYPGTVIEGGADFERNPCWVSPNWSDWPLVANSQKSNEDDTKTNWQLPENVAIRLIPGEMLMVQTHYANHGEQPTKFGARVGINFHSYQRAGAPVEMGTLFATKQSIRVCQSRPTPTYSGTCRFPNAATITAANGHFHQRGERFSIYPWDGASLDHPAESTKFYESLSWDEPPMAINLAVPAPTNSGIWWDCQYRWTPPTIETCADVNAKDPMQANDCCYTFGGNTDVGEHCNVFLYYYPKVESDVFCL